MKAVLMLWGIGLLLGLGGCAEQTQDAAGEESGTTEQIPQSTEQMPQGSGQTGVETEQMAPGSGQTGTGTEQGQTPDQSVSVVHTQADVEDFFFQSTPATVSKESGVGAGIAVGGTDLSRDAGGRTYRGFRFYYGNDG